MADEQTDRHSAREKMIIAVLRQRKTVLPVHATWTDDRLDHLYGIISNSAITNLKVNCSKPKVSKQIGVGLCRFL